jgi:predicted enzyme related to lactoylglutathione lyase
VARASVQAVFARYSLRTTDAPAGRRFYRDAIGLDLPEGADPESVLEAWPLHERARAMGAPPHWLGQIAVDDAETTVERMVDRGGQRLGPGVEVSTRVRYATLRDPFGAVVAVRQGEPPRTDAPVAWHQLHTRDADSAMELYCGLFGWTHSETLETRDPEGGHRLFTFDGGGEPVGAIANTSRWAGVHTHWLFYFPVEDVGATVARVRDLGGTAAAPVRLPGSGPLLAACDDPQGAAFGVVGRN